MGLCDTLLMMKRTLSQQLEDLDTALANQWLACIAADTLPGGPAASQSAIDIQLRIDALIPFLYDPNPAKRMAAMNAINAYNGYLLLLSQRAQTQSQLNSVVLQMLQNNCPLE